MVALRERASDAGAEEARIREACEAARGAARQQKAAGAADASRRAKEEKAGAEVAARQQGEAAAEAQRAAQARVAEVARAAAAEGELHRGAEAQGREHCARSARQRRTKKTKTKKQKQKKRATHGRSGVNVARGGGRRGARARAEAARGDGELVATCIPRCTGKVKLTFAERGAAAAARRQEPRKQSHRIQGGSASGKRSKQGWAMVSPSVPCSREMMRKCVSSRVPEAKESERGCKWWARGKGSKFTSLPRGWRDLPRSYSNHGLPRWRDRWDGFWKIYLSLPTSD